MSAGKLDQLIQLQRPVDENTGGNLDLTYDDVGDPVWAEVISQRGSEAFEAARVNARETVRVRVRFRPDIDVDWRIVWDEQAYSIKSCDRSQRRAGWLWFTAEISGAGRADEYLGFDELEEIYDGADAIVDCCDEIVTPGAVGDSILVGCDLLYDGTEQIVSN